MRQLTDQQHRDWRQHGYVVMPGYLRGTRLTELLDWSEQLEAWPETPGKWMKYFEKGPADERLLCRVENFIPYHDGLNELICGARTYDLVSELMDEPAVLFKEKINFKMPGGAGFTPHQDAPAFTSFDQTYHITMLIAVDASTVENGCLEIVDDHAACEMLPQAADGTIAPEVVERLAWHPLPTSPGDMVLFHSYVPHRSGPNRSKGPRRAYYITYNRKSEGERRDDYYRHKRSVFPPDCERQPGVDYSAGAGVYNLGNPIH